MIEETTSLPGVFKLRGCMDFYLPKRYVFVFLTLMGSIIVYIIRAAVSISIVAMVNHADEIFKNNTVNECPVNSSQMIRNEYKGKQYEWDVRQQSHFLGCVSYGNIATQILGGILAEKFGFKFVYGGGILMTGIITLLIPVFSDLGFTAVIVIRVIQGLGEGLTLPAINAAISIWSPINERSRVSAIIFSGLQIGLVIGMPISGLLCSTDFLGGWPSVYYVFELYTIVEFTLLIPVEQESLTVVSALVGDHFDHASKGPKECGIAPR
nr:sialin-like [Parasteatoda tepidariorum]